MPQPCKAIGTPDAETPLAPMMIERRAVGPQDVAIDIAYCGICHSDIHTARNEWGRSLYPCVPGHEIIGHVTAIGENVSDFRIGERVGVGCMIGSCRECGSCREGDEQYCERGMIGTYGSPARDREGPTLGGYADHIVVDEHFVLRIPEGLESASAAPLLCAGITSWSPLAHWNVRAGQKVAIIGLGGLGHMGVKFAKALGAEVYLITSSEDKGHEAVSKFKANGYILSSDKQAMRAHTRSFDFILNTVPVGHAINPFLFLLKKDGVMVIVGALEEMEKFHAGLVVSKRCVISGSAIGGIQQTQEMLDFCAAHNITCDIELISAAEVNQAYDRVVAGDVKYRFVIDMTNL